MMDCNVGLRAKINPVLPKVLVFLFVFFLFFNHNSRNEAKTYGKEEEFFGLPQGK